MTDMMATLRQTLVQQTHEALRASVREILTGDRNLSQELRAQVKEISQRAEELTKRVKGSSVPSHSVSGKSQTLSSASSSSSSSSSSTASERDVGQDPLFQLQRLRDELTTLKVRFQRDREAAQLASRKKLMREELQIALQEEPGVFEGLSGPSLKMTVRQNAKDILDVQSAKKKKRAARRAASSANPSSSSSAASSSGPSTSTPVVVAPRGVSSSVRSHDVTFFMTSLAKKHLAVLKRMPGYEDKFDDFVEEVERNPWARKGHGEFFVGAHTKLLKGYDNVFSKRFASKERFLYRVEKGPDGKVCVTILSLLKHDL